MHFVASVSALCTAIRAAKTALAPRTKRPTLHFTAGSLVTVSGASHNVGVHALVPDSNTIQPGSLVVCARSLHEFLRDRTGLIHISHTAKHCEMAVMGRTTHRYRIPLKGSFVRPPTYEPFENNTQDVILCPVKLKAALRRTLFAVSLMNTKRYTLAGIYWDNTRLVATNAHILAIAEHGTPSLNGLTSAWSAKVLGRLLRRTGNVHARFGKTWVQFQQGNTLLTTSLLPGRFPPYRQIIPTKFGTQVTLDAGQLAHAIRKANHQITLTFRQGRLTVASNGGEANVPLRQSSGPPITVVVKRNDLRGILECTDQMLEVQMNGPHSPIRWNLADEAEWLLMPVI